MTAVSPEVDPLALERQVCFALAVTNRAVLAVYRPLLAPLGITHPQYLVMLALWDHAKSGADDTREALSVKQIAALLQTDSATISPMLKRLESLGLITRPRSTADERTTHVTLTSRAPRFASRPSASPPRWWNVWASAWPSLRTFTRY
ncbi:marR family protein [Mycobacteroides abscessus subsp. bolletii 1513]|uniref:MarR family protein n=1 Tax=Mycobacteroides abscessus subsp. bolletii 1513 TaxID=1299321 RepID=X8DR83_9MYCO|nr:marR family protein [Mycobacteroides abscessus subsp. bolletii 1513]